MLRAIMDSTLQLSESRSPIVEHSNDVNINVNTDIIKVVEPTEELDPTVPAWAKQPNKPEYTAEEVGALPDTTDLPSRLSDLEDDPEHRTVTDTEKESWSRGSGFSGDYNDLINKPTNLSDFNNDEGFVTEEQVPTIAEWAKQPTKPEYTAAEVGALPIGTKIPSKVSDLLNDTGYITGYTEIDPTVPSWAKAENKPSYTAAEVGALPAGTAIPSKTSDLENDSKFITEEEIEAVTLTDLEAMWRGDYTNE